MKAMGAGGRVTRLVDRGAMRNVDEGGDGKTGQGRFWAGVGVVVGGEWACKGIALVVDFD